MSALQLFSYSGQEVRTQLIDGGADITDNTIYRHMLQPVRMPEQDGNRG